MRGNTGFRLTDTEAAPLYEITPVLPSAAIRGCSDCTVKGGAAQRLQLQAHQGRANSTLPSLVKVQDSHQLHRGSAQTHQLGNQQQQQLFFPRINYKVQFARLFFLLLSL